MKKNIASIPIKGDYGEFKIDMFDEPYKHPVTVQYLIEALDLSEQARSINQIDLFDEAIKKVDTARGLDSNYAETKKMKF